jgi:hypothetical protein
MTKTNQTITALIILVVIAVIAIFAIRASAPTTPSDTQQTSTLPSASVPAAGVVTIRGTIVCLPHANPGDVQTMECAFGLKDAAGNYFALTDSSSSYSNISSTPMNVTVDVHGDFKPQSGTIYATVGTITVDKITQVTSPVTATSTLNAGATTSDGIITFATPSDFGLAVSGQQLPSGSYIPACDAGFNYCLYYKGTTYAGSNFESAGISIVRRPDLKTETSCLTTAPARLESTVKPVSSKTTDVAYASSVFANTGDGAAGHYSDGAVSRLFVRKTSSCYQFETRVGQTQFQNYPAGTVKEFTSSDLTLMKSKLTAILNRVTITTGGQASLFQ